MRRTVLLRTRAATEMEALERKRVSQMGTARAHLAYKLCDPRTNRLLRPPFARWGVDLTSGGSMPGVFSPSMPTLQLTTDTVS